MKVSRSPARSVVTRLAILVLIAAAVVYLFMYLDRGQTESESRGQQPNPYPAEPENVAFLDEEIFYEDLGTMTADAHLVVKGTVLQAAPGKHHDLPAEAGGPYTERELTLRIDEVIRGNTPPELPSTIRVVEGWWADGVGFAREGMPWSQAGAQGYFYLVNQPGNGPDGPYSYITSNGRVLVVAQGVDPSGDEEGGPWASLRSDATARELEDLIRAAAASPGAKR